MSNPFDTLFFGTDQPPVTRPSRVRRARINAPREMAAYMSEPGQDVQARREVEYLISLIMEETSSLYLECRDLDYFSLSSRLMRIFSGNNLYAHFQRHTQSIEDAYWALASVLIDEISEVIGPILKIEGTGSPRIRLDVAEFTIHAIDVELAIY